MDSLISLLETGRSGKKVVFTNGCFDILHVGHVQYLQEARAFGDILIVGVNNDASVSTLKGPGRPIFSEAHRARIIASLESVNYVVIFSESTPIELVKRIQPDIHVKGGDYREEDLPEAEIVRDYGGDIAIVPYIDNYSTSRIIQEILDRFGN